MGTFEAKQVDSASIDTQDEVLLSVEPKDRNTIEVFLQTDGGATGEFVIDISADGDTWHEQHTSGSSSESWSGTFSIAAPHARLRVKSAAAADSTATAYLGVS